MAHRALRLICSNLNLRLNLLDLQPTCQHYAQILLFLQVMLMFAQYSCYICILFVFVFDAALIIILTFLLIPTFSQQPFVNTSWFIWRVISEYFNDSICRLYDSVCGLGLVYIEEASTMAFCDRVLTSCAFFPLLVGAAVMDATLYHKNVFSRLVYNFDNFSN